MPEIRSPQLSLTTVDDRVTIEVSYAAALTPLERFLASRGLRFRDSVTIEGDDTAEDPTPFTPVVLPSPDPALIPVTAGDDELEVPRVFTVTCARGELQEDPGHDADELVARIDIGVEGMPGNARLFTSAKRLLGQASTAVEATLGQVTSAGDTACIVRRDHRAERSGHVPDEAVLVGVVCPVPVPGHREGGTGGRL